MARPKKNKSPSQSLDQTDAPQPNSPESLPGEQVSALMPVESAPSLEAKSSPPQPLPSVDGVELTEQEAKRYEAAPERNKERVLRAIRNVRARVAKEAEEREKHPAKGLKTKLNGDGEQEIVEDAAPPPKPIALRDWELYQGLKNDTTRERLVVETQKEKFVSHLMRRSGGTREQVEKILNSPWKQ